MHKNEQMVWYGKTGEEPKTSPGSGKGCGALFCLFSVARDGPAAHEKVFMMVLRMARVYCAGTQ